MKPNPPPAPDVDDVDPPLSVADLVSAIVDGDPVRLADYAARLRVGDDPIVFCTLDTDEAGEPLASIWASRRDAERQVDDTARERRLRVQAWVLQC
jgi:hypothetical protein